jgi:predicted type IV restriction endonuclease/SAM-dependent methyltransferase
VSAPKKLVELVETFREHYDDYKSGKFNEAQARVQFINPMFELLGWDMGNLDGSHEAFKDVVHEDSLKIGTNWKAPDYSFRVGGVRRFFLEAKKPAINIKDDFAPAFQLRRYGWSANLPISVLTDFEEFAVYDCRAQPTKEDKASTARLMYLRFDEYVEQWDMIYSIFSKSAVFEGSIEKLAGEAKKKRGTATVDEAFLAEIEGWREQLARNIALRNPELSVRELNTAVQRTIDRIVFLRMAEDRGIEAYGRLQSLVKAKDLYKDLAAIFRQADDRYNSGLFHFKKGDGSAETLDYYTLDLIIDDKVLKGILKSLYYPDSPYEFSVLPADILGQVYEQFLGKVICLKGKSATVEEKPEVKKAGGVYYTPAHIVERIVEETLGKALLGKNPNSASGLIPNAHPLRVLDPACGSGSFLIVAYQYLLDWYLAEYIQRGASKHAKGKSPKLYKSTKNDWRLTIEERRRILLTHIYGVDIDAQAVEVTKLSLLLKVLEGESGDAIANQMDMFKTRALPDLGSNIKCGNSLISSDFFGLYSSDSLTFEEKLTLNAFDWDKSFFDGWGRKFDLVIGNPPYLYSAGKNYQRYFEEHYSAIQYQTDFYQFFIERAYDLVETTGIISYIVPDSWMNSEYFSNLRKKMIFDHNLSKIIIFEYFVFRKANIENTIFVSAPNKLKSIEVDISPAPARFSPYSRLQIADIKRLGIVNPRFRPEDEALIKKLDKGNNFETIYELNRGLHAYRTDGYGLSKFGKGTQTKRDKDERSYHSKQKEDSTYLPEVRGRDVGYFDYQTSGEFVSYGKWLAEPRLPKFFKSPKVVARKILGKKLACSLIEEDAAIDQALYIILSRKNDQTELLLALGILGSSLGAWYLRTKYAIYDFLHPWYTKKQIAEFPLPPSVGGIADAVLRLKSAKDAEALAKIDVERAMRRREVERLEEALDTTVFDAYGLTQAERKIVTK